MKQEYLNFLGWSYNKKAGPWLRDSIEDWTDGADRKIKAIKRLNEQFRVAYSTIF